MSEATFTLMANGISLTHQRLSFAIPMFDLPLWLSLQSIYPKFFWHARDDETVVAGLGEALSFDHIPRFTTSDNSTSRFFGGLSFSEKPWENFPHAYFFLPLL